jgi:tetratricopeptide (TPR) repeat protein
LADSGRLSPVQVGAVLRVDQEQRWNRGQRITAETYLQEHTLRLTDDESVRLIVKEFRLRQAAGEAPKVQEYLNRFPRYTAQIQRELGSGASPAAPPAPLPRPPLDVTMPPSDIKPPAAPPRPPLDVTMPPSDIKPPAAPPRPPLDVTMPPSDIKPPAAPPRPPLDVTMPPSDIQAPAVDPLFAPTMPPTPAPAEILTDPSLNLPPPSAAEAAAAYQATVAPGEDSAAPSQPCDPYQPTIAPPGTGETNGSTGGPKRVGNYEILGELGRGGMGVVYKARDLQLKRVVALKMVLAGAHAGAQDMARFRAEAEAAARLQHTNIVQIYEVGEQEGYPYFSLEFVDGKSLAQKLLGIPLPDKQAAEMTEQLARAMDTAHKRGVVHRDLKPGNVMLTSDGVPKITDFGLAKRLDDNTGQTATGTVMGTPSYMAPEQAMGNIKAIGPAADTYALGAMLYEMLTGRPPFQAATMIDTLDQVCHDEPVPPSRLQPKLPRDLETICLKCLQKEAAKRYDSAMALADDLGRFLRDEPIRARPTSAWERAVKWARRRPAIVALIGVSALALLSIVVLIIWQNANLQVEVKAAREAQEEATRGEQLAKVRADVEQLLRQGELAYRDQNWQEASRRFTAALDRIGEEAELDDVRTQARDWLEKTRPRVRDAEAYRKARDRYDRFRKFFDDARFHETLFTGADAGANRATARTEALQALKLFGVTPDSKDPPQVDPAYFNAAEKAEITAKTYALLLLLAEAEARTMPQEPLPERRRKAAQALAILDRATKLELPLTKAFYLQRARYLAQSGDAAGAKKDLEAATQLKPSAELDYFLTGSDAYHRGDLPSAIRDFEQALRLQPDAFWPQYLLAICYLKSQRPTEAKASLTACLGRRPDFVWAYLLRGFAESELGNFEAAEADFQNALDRRPNPADQYGMYVYRGVMRLRKGQLDEAAADFQKAIALQPNAYPAYVNLAQVYQKQDKADAAIQQFDQAIRLDPNQAALYRNRARLQRDRKNLPAALQDLDRAIALETGAGPSAELLEDQLERGRLLMQTDKAAAVDTFDQAIKINPEYAPAHRLRGEALLDLKRYENAVRAFDKCILLTSNPDPALYQERGLALAKLGDYRSAVEDYSRALALKQDSYTFAARGWAQVARDNLKPALADFEEAIRIDPKNGYAYNGRGYVRVKQGQYRLATADAETALKFGPEAPGLLHNAARIFAQAVSKLDALNRQPDRETLDARFRYQERAGQLLRQALRLLPAKERNDFWAKSVRADPDFKPIRQSPGFVDLDREYHRPANGKAVSSSSSQR